MKKSISKFNQVGGWTSSHSFQYRCAIETCEQFDKTIQLLREKEKEVKNNNPNIPIEDINMYIYHKTEDIWHEAYKLATMVRLFACMAIEALLNYYGTRLVGEIFYKQNLERLTITQKIAVLIALGSNNLIEKNDQLIIRMQKFFEARNQLVHPKSREIKSSNIEEVENKNPKDIDMSQVIVEMEQILLELCEINPDIMIKEFISKK
jgi:hypothetical protein